jgi:hypothetical protein
MLFSSQLLTTRSTPMQTPSKQHSKPHAPPKPPGLPPCPPPLFADDGPWWAVTQLGGLQPAARQKAADVGLMCRALIAMPLHEASQRVAPVATATEQYVWEAPLRRFFAEKEKVAMWADGTESLLPLRSLLEFQSQLRHAGACSASRS